MRRLAWTILLLCASTASALCQEAANLETALSIEHDRPQPLFSRMSFFAGEKIRLQIEGQVTPVRAWDYRTRCTNRILGICTSKSTTLEVVHEANASISTLPILAIPRDTEGAAPASDRVDPPLASAPTFANGADPVITLAAPGTTVHFKLPADIKLDDAAKGYVLHAFIADKAPATGSTRRNLCSGAAPGQCGTGRYMVRIVEVDVSERLSRVTGLLQGDQRVQAAVIDKLVDFWLRNDVVGSAVRPSKARLAQLSLAVVQQALKHPLDPSLEGGDRRALLEKAIELDPSNNTAHAHLISYLVKNGDFTAAKMAVQKKMPALLDDFETTDRTPGKVNPKAYIEYAQALVAAADISSGQRAGAIGSEVNAAVALAGTAAGVLEKLRAREVDWTQLYKPEDARRGYIAALERLAAVSQLHRNSLGLDTAAGALRKARSFFESMKPGVIVAAGGNGRHLLTAATSVSARAPVTGGAELGLSTEVRLLPAGLHAVTATFAQERIATAPGRVALWNEGEIEDEVSEIVPLASNERVARAYRIPGRTRLSITGPAGKRVIERRDGSTASSLDVVALGASDTMARLGSDNVVTLTRRDNSETARDFGTGAATDVADLAVSGELVAILHRTRNVRIAQVDAAGPAPLLMTLPGADTVDISAVQMVFTESKRLVVLTSENLCVSPPLQPLPGTIAAPTCRPHGVQAMATRILAPGLVSLKSDTIAFAVRRDDNSSVRIMAVDAAAWNAPAGSPSAPSSTSPAGLIDFSFAEAGAWDRAFLTNAFTGTSREQRLVLMVPTVSARLRVIDLASQTLVQAREEPQFSGLAMLNGEHIRVVDRETGRLREPGQPVPANAPLGSDRLDSAGGEAWYVLARDTGGADPTLVTGWTRFEPGNPAGTTETLGSPHRLLWTPTRDHSRAQASFAFVRPRGLNEAEAVILEAATGTRTTVDLGSGRASDIIGVLALGAAAIVLERRGGEIVARRSNGTAIMGEPVLAGPLAEVNATQSVYLANRRIMVRAMTRDGSGEFVDIWSVDGTTWSFKRDTFATVGLRTAADGGPARRFGIGTPQIGFADAESGSLVLPGNVCMRVGLRARPTSPASTEILESLPTLVPMSLHIALAVPRVLVGLPNGIQVRLRDRATRAEDPPADCTEQGYAF